MIFRRTSNGLSNQHLFLKVDAIVFVEGGKGFSKEDVYRGKYDRGAIDIKFWRGIFSIFNKTKKYQFRAIGSKSTLLNIADDIDAGKVKNVFIAMDRDFDPLKNKTKNVNGVIYTYGYSWENDVWKPEIVEDVLSSICVADCSDQKVKDLVKEIYSQFLEQIKIVVCADALLSTQDKSFIPRKKHLRCLQFGRKIKPSVKLEEFKKQFDREKISEEQAVEFGKKHQINIQNDCFGHLLSDFCYWLIIYMGNILGNIPKLPKDYILLTGIDKFISKLKKKEFPELFKYYETSISF